MPDTNAAPSVDEIAAAYEARVAAVPEAARRFASEIWGETWAHAEMGSLLDFAALIAAAPVASVERVRHLKRGTEYEVLARGVRLQGDAHEPDTLVFYRGADGQLWAREEGEFDDGRFERIDAAIDAPAREKPPFRTGDLVRHKPSGETWTVAYADPVSNNLAWCGWPDGTARVTDCELIEAASDEQHRGTLREVIKAGGTRAAAAQRLYGDPDAGEVSHG